MTTTIAAPTIAGAPHSDRPATRLRWAVSDTLTITRRNLLALTRIPEALFFSAVQPIMFVLLFVYVFGNAIKTPGSSYVNYLMAGVFVQTVAFGSVSTSVGLAEDLQKGLIERFRALPMARSAVLVGRTTATASATSWRSSSSPWWGCWSASGPPPACWPTSPPSSSSCSSPTPSRGASR